MDLSGAYNAIQFFDGLADVARAYAGVIVMAPARIPNSVVT